MTGQLVKVTLDGPPEETLDGDVTRSAAVANEHDGDKVFNVTVALSDVTGLKWGMSANVEMNTNP